ncbi:unnamed protein product [Mucor fragilis]
MSNPKQAVHPFFQPRKPQEPLKVSSPLATSTPEKRHTSSLLDATNANDMEATPARLPPATDRVTRSQLQKHQKAAASCPRKYVETGECSTPYHVPMAKPKFYSDTVKFQEQLDHEASLDCHGKKRSCKKKQAANDHEFSRMKPSIFGHGHMTDKTFEPGSFRFPTPAPNTSMAHYIKDHQQHPVRSGSSRVASPRKLPQLAHILVLCAVAAAYFRHASPRGSQQQAVDRQVPATPSQRALGPTTQLPIPPRLASSNEGSAPVSTQFCHRHNKEAAKKKQKKLVMQHDVDLDDEDAFLKSLSLYEDEQDEDFMVRPGSSRKELKKESMRSNIILLVGDHGIGKTASVYTIAEQMDYEVFEINAGARRSGKDIMSAVGEMTKSHLVAFCMAPQASAGSLFLEKPASTATKPGKKKRLNPSLRSSLSATTASQPASLKDFLVKKKPAATTDNIPATAPPATKQSLILLEEVDLLFEEDKGFWAAVIELSQKSKRPIIMTCNDPEQVPIENMSLQVIIDMKPPTENELLAYLWLVCLAEGYTVDPADLVCLVAFLGRDVRQLIQTLELFAGQGIFGHYLGIDKRMSILETKSRCVQSRVAIDTFRLVRAYQQLDGYVKQEEPNALDDLEKILENNAFIDTWLGWKENGAMIQESVQDQLNGYTTLWVEDDEDSACKHMSKEIVCIATVLNNAGVDWIMDEESHWDELCDAKSLHYQDYKEAIDPLLPARQQHLPQESMVMMEYIPYIQQMMVPVDKPSESRTRSKRKRRHLPLSSDAVATLSNHRAPIDETQFHIQVLFDLSKSS